MKTVTGWTGVFLVGCCLAQAAYASEVEDITHTRVIVREHPKTGKPYVSIVSSEAPIPKNPFTGQHGATTRPDYRLLDPQVKNGAIPYIGPSSDRRKVYVFAASLMTVGTVGGAVGMAAAPAQAAGAATGGGAYVAAGSVAAGGTAAGVLSQRSRTPRENFRQESESKVLSEKNEKPNTRNP